MSNAVVENSAPNEKGPKKSVFYLHFDKNVFISISHHLNILQVKFMDILGNQYHKIVVVDSACR